MMLLCMFVCFFCRETLQRFNRKQATGVRLPAEMVDQTSYEHVSSYYILRLLRYAISNMDASPYKLVLNIFRNCCIKHVSIANNKGKKGDSTFWGQMFI